MVPFDNQNISNNNKTPYGRTSSAYMLTFSNHHRVSLVVDKGCVIYKRLSSYGFDGLFREITLSALKLNIELL